MSDVQQRSALWLQAHFECQGNRDDMWDWLERRHNDRGFALMRIATEEFDHRIFRVDCPLCTLECEGHVPDHVVIARQALGFHD